MEKLMFDHSKEMFVRKQAPQLLALHQHAILNLVKSKFGRFFPE